MSSRFVLPALVLGLILLGAIPSDAVPVPKSQADATQALSAIRIMPGGNNFSIAAGTSTALNDALSQWNAVCGSNVPALSKTQPSSITFVVNYVKGVFNLTNKPDDCAGTPIPTPGTVLGGGTITIFEETINGADCTGLYKEITMHEIGHRLGLNHSLCTDNIMLGEITQAMSGLNPTSADCAAVDDFWLTTEENLSTCSFAPGSFASGSLDSVCIPPTCECSFDSDCDSQPPPEFGTWVCRFCR